MDCVRPDRKLRNSLPMPADNQINSTYSPRQSRHLSSAKTFKQLFCRYTHSPAEKFEQTLFKRSLYPHARIVAPLLLRFYPGIFREDLAVVQELASVESPDVFQMEVSRFYGRNVRDSNSLRKLLLIRLSGKRLLKWKSKCFVDAAECS